jgi:chemotaxis-related protein WspD
MNKVFLQKELDWCDRQRWRQQLAAPLVDEQTGQLVKLFVFRAGGEWLGIEPSAVVLTEPMPPVHSVPQRGQALVGVVNVRGSVTLCFSIADALHCLSGPVSVRPMMVVLVYEGWKVACRVDDVAGIRSFDRDTLAEPPATLACAATRHVLGMFQADKVSVAWLDRQKLFHTLQEAAR